MRDGGGAWASRSRSARTTATARCRRPAVPPWAGRGWGGSRRIRQRGCSRVTSACRWRPSGSSGSCSRSFEEERVLTTIAVDTMEDTISVLIFVKLLSSQNEDVCEKAVWALGNIASNTTICRDLVLAHGVLFSGNVKLSMLQKASWALLNICHGLSQVNFEPVKPALPVLRQLIHSQDDEVLSNACRALSYLSDDGNDNIQDVIEAGAFPH